MITVSVTGIAAPSLDAKLSNAMDLPLGMRRTPIFGLGCVAGAAGIGQAADYVRAYPDRIAVLLSVELCSLTWQRMDLSVANMIASGLFADGSAAVVVAGDQVKADGARNSRLSFQLLSQHGTSDGLGHFRRGISDRFIPGCPRRCP